MYDLYWWALTDSNRRPFRLYRNAQNRLIILNKKKTVQINVRSLLVGVDGFEPPILPIASECSEPAELNAFQRIDLRTG